MDGVNNSICKHCLKKHWEHCNISKHGYHYKHSGCPNTHTIHNPHWYPDNLFFYKEESENTKQYFGFELEYEFFEDTSAYDDISNSIVSTDKDKHYWLSQDHSLDCGWELKNHPMTYNYIINSKEIKDLFNNIKKACCHNECGLHFHISRNSFTEDGIKNLDWFINTYDEFCSQYGGRRYNEYCENNPENQTETQLNGETETVSSMIILNIEGMMCPHCEARVRDALLMTEGVKSAEVSHKSGEARVEGTCTGERLVAVVEAAGYKVISVK